MKAVTSTCLYQFPLVQTSPRS